MNFSRLIAVAAILFALNFGYSFATPLVKILLSAYESQNWPQTSGTVIHTEVKQDRKGRTYALVEYAYPVNGQEYQSSRVSFMGLDDGAPSPQEVVALYAAQKGVTVFFDPNNPGESVLRPGLHSYFPLGLLAVGLLVVASAIVSMVRVVLRTRRTGKAGAAPESAH